MYKMSKYITITKDGYFIDRRPTDYYRSVQIVMPSKDLLYDYFTKYLEERGIQEIHALTSKTRGTFLKPGKPSRKNGKTIWCRVKMVDGTVGNWVCVKNCYSTKIAALFCIKCSVDNIVAVVADELRKVVLPQKTDLNKRQSEIISSVLDLSRVR